MDLFAPRHLLIILLIVLIVFGGKKLKSLGSDLGAAVRGFKKSMSDAENEDPKQIPGPPVKDAEFPEVAAQKPQGTEHKTGSSA